MKNFSQVQKLKIKPWVVVGMLLSLTIIGVGGCGTKATTAATSGTEVTQATAATAQKSALNPAIEAAMGIRRLQDNQATVLTSEQKAKIKPILQTLIDTSSPTQDFLQKKADAIKAVFTDAQKTYLSTNTQKDKPAGNSQKGQGEAKEPPSDQAKGQSGAPSGNQTAPTDKSQDIFKQVLASLT
ncbi:MAG TPA: hypothetical protein VN456_06480 [Desulfosporosinus sp.]|nr:hypothetical protein [Desulfosporosinus sp.]